MSGIQTHQMKTMYAVARSLGMDNDALHALVAGVAGAESIKALTALQADEVIRELKARQKSAGVQPSAPKATRGVSTRL